MTTAVAAREETLPAPTKTKTAQVKLIGLFVALAGALLMATGGFTWGLITSNLAAERIVVSEDASMLAGKPVKGPFTAFAEAQIINEHALKATDGKTYAELDRDDPVRNTAMNASFLRASLFTSVLAYGVSAMAMGTGLVMVLTGHSLRKLSDN